MVAIRNCVTVVLLLGTLLVSSSAEYEDSFEDIQDIDQPLDDEYNMMSRDFEDEYQEPENLDDGHFNDIDDEVFSKRDEPGYINEIDDEQFSKRDEPGYNWFETTLKNVAKIVVKYKLNDKKSFGSISSRSIRSEGNESKSIIEKDTFIIDVDENAVMDAIERKDGKELTVLDYTMGVMAVLTPADKMCRLHEIPEEARAVNLAEQKEQLEALSESGKIVETTENDEDQVDYRESSKVVNDKAIGAKIVQICNAKKYKMVWMESFDTGAEKRELDEDQFGEEPSEDLLSEDLQEGEVDKRSCSKAKVWQCSNTCTTSYIDKSYCCRKCPTNPPCVRKCYKNVRDKFCCKKKCVYYYRRQPYCCLKSCIPKKCSKYCIKQVPKKTCRKCCGWVYKPCCECKVTVTTG